VTFVESEVLSILLAKTIATSLIHSKVDYCNSLFLNPPCSQLDRLQLILNSAARAFLKLLDSSIFHLFENTYIGSKSISAYTTKFSQSPTKHSNLASPPICTIFSISNRTFVTLKRPTVSSRLKLTDRSFTHHAPVLWNALPKEFREPVIHSSHAIQFGSTPPS